MKLIIIALTLFFKIGIAQTPLLLTIPSYFAQLDTSKFGIQTNKIIFLIDNKNNFKVDVSASKVSLDSLALFLRRNPAYLVEISVNSYGVSKNASTLTLSAARAQDVVDYLVNVKFIASNRLVGQGSNCQPIFFPGDTKKHFKIQNPETGIWTTIKILSKNHYPR